MTREEAIGLLATKPEVITSHFGITRPEIMEAVSDKVIQEIREECQGTFTSLVTIPLPVASSLTGLTRESLLRNEHVDGGNRAKKMTLKQVQDALDGRTKNARNRSAQ